MGLEKIAELCRQDPLTGEWISIAAARQSRVVARAFEGLLIQAGRARYVFSWSELAKLRGPDGAEVDLAPLVRSAVDDPRQVNALHDGLMRWGITPASAPGAAPLPR